MARSLIGRMAVGHPVDVATGAMFQDVEDRVMPGRLPLVFARRYSTGLTDTAGGMFGPGWASPFEMVLLRDLEGYRLIAEDGESEIGFDDANDEVARGKTVRNLGAFHELRQDQNTLIATKWDPESLEVKRYFFRVDRNQTPWPLIAVEDVRGNRIDIHRDGAGRIVLIRQRRQQRGLELVYNSAGRVVEVYLRAGVEEKFQPGRKGPPQGRLILRYKYNPGGRLCELRDALDQYCTYEYDAAGRLSREVDFGGLPFWFRYDSRGRCIETTGADGFGRTSLSYLDDGVTTLVDNGLDQITTYLCNATGQVERVTSPLGNATSNIYDSHGRITQILRADGTTVQFGYNETGDRHRVVAPSGATQHWEFNANHQVTARIDPAGHRWEYAYDSAGRHTSTRMPTGRALTFRHDERGDLVEVAEADGTKKRYEWDEAGNLTRVTDWLGKSHSYEYDEQGYPTAFVDALGNRFLAVNDALGRVREQRFPDGGIRRFGYDRTGMVTETVDEEGAVTKMRFTGCGLLRDLVRPNGAKVEFHWNQATQQLASIVNERGEEHHFAYDPDGRLVEETDFSGRTVAYEHDKMGRVVAVTDEQGRRSSFAHTPDGLLAEVVHDDGSGATYEHDALGRVIKADNQQCVIEREFDALGRVIREKQGAHEVRSQFDALGNRVRRSSSLGYHTEFRWNANGQIASMGSRGFAPIAFEYDDQLNEISRYVPQGAAIRHAYDSRSRCVEQIVQGSRKTWVEGSNWPINRQFVYDRAGNFKQIHDQQWGLTHYDYDPAGRVTRALLPNGLAESYAYDDADNLTRLEREQPSPQRETVLPTGTEERTYSQGSRLEEGSGAVCTHDSAGRVVSRRDGQGETHYSWDRFGQLTCVRLPNGSEWHYRYDPYGRRIQKQGPSGAVDYVWDGDVVLHEIHRGPSGEQHTVHWEHEPRNFAPVAKIEGDNQYLCVNDPLGTPRELITREGAVVWSAHLTPFGEMATRGRNQVDCPVRFQGQWHDDETGLHYNRLRYYDPRAGRYLSPDPLGLLGGLNPYRYTACPVNFIDPLGLVDTLPLDGWRYSQTTAGGKNGERYDKIKPSMEKGWDYDQKPVDVVELPASKGGHKVGFDNTRPLVAQELGWTEIPVTVHKYDDPINRSEITVQDEKWFAKMREKGHKLGDPPTWGELLEIRTKGNNLPVEGTTNQPKVVRCKK